MGIFGVGLNQTGTTTLGVCLRHWGFRHISFDGAAFTIAEKTDTKAPLALASRSQSFEDWTWAFYYSELDRALADSWFILPCMHSTVTWFQSLYAHANRARPCCFGALVYVHAIPHQYRGVHIRFCESHLKAARNYFRNRSHNLLKVCRKAGDEWITLADFLETVLHNIPFPHA